MCRSRKSQRSPRTAFTLIETIVVILIIGVLSAILISVVQASRDSARRIQCSNNLKQIGIAIQSYSATFGCLPPAYSTRLFDGARETSPMWGWGAHISSNLEVIAYNAINLSQKTFDIANKTAYSTRVASFLCPSSPDYGPVQVFSFMDSITVMFDGIAPSNYIASAGTRSLSKGPVPAGGGDSYTLNDNEDGAMYRNSFVTFSALTDGSSNTLMVGERSRNLADATWVGPAAIGVYAVRPRSSFSVRCVSANILVLGHTGPENSKTKPTWCDRPNFPQADPDSYWSCHQGGCNFLLCDGAVRFVRDSIDPRTFSFLATRSGQEAVSADSY